MGGRWYTPKNPDSLPDAPENSTLGQPCMTSSQGGGPYGRQITSIGEACPRFKSNFSYDETFQADVAYSRSENVLFTFEDSASFRYKLYDTKGIDTELPYNIAADNIQYEDFTGVCGGGPYNRLRYIKMLAGFKGTISTK
ncbi:hypothetical protein MRX96_055545 [Rhipicephalus microplus]